MFHGAYLHRCWSHLNDFSSTVFLYFTTDLQCAFFAKASEIASILPLTFVFLLAINVILNKIAKTHRTHWWLLLYGWENTITIKTIYTANMLTCPIARKEHVFLITLMMLSVTTV